MFTITLTILNIYNYLYKYLYNYWQKRQYQRVSPENSN